MKYPSNQFELLKKSLSILSVHFDFSNIHPCQIHYMVYQNASEGQEHNALYINDFGQIVRGYAAKKNIGFRKLISFLNDSNFLLYPEGCNDMHIETAVKNAIKQLS